MRIRNPFVVSIAFLLLFAFESAAPVAHADAVKRVIKVITRSDLAAKKADNQAAPKGTIAVARESLCRASADAGCSAGDQNDEGCERHGVFRSYMRP